MSSRMGEVLHWKKLWQLTAGFNNESSTEFVSEKLRAAESQLHDGLLQYKPSSTTSMTKLRSKLELESNMKLQNILKKLHQFMGIDALQMWDLLCFYLVSEFRGSATSLEDFTVTESRMSQLITDIWGFYTSERMFMLKLLSVIIEYSRDPKHPYSQEYYNIINKISLDKLRKSLIEQFEHLVREAPPSVLENGEFCTPHIQKLWAERNMREQIQILHLLLLTVNEIHITHVDLVKIVSLFKEHNFGRQPIYLRHLNEAHNCSVQKIIYSEVALFLRCVDMTNVPDKSSWISSVTSTLDSQIATLHHSEEHSAILLTWMLLNLQSTHGEELFASRYSQFGTKALQLQVYEFLYKMVSHIMFKDRSKVSNIVYQAVFNHLNVLCQNFDHDGSVSQQPFMFELVGELLSSPLLVEQFCKDEDQGLHSVFTTAQEIFPCEFVPLSTLAEGIARASPAGAIYVMNHVTTLLIFTQEYDPDNIRVSSVEPGSENVIVRSDYSPLPYVDYVIPINSEAVILDRKNKTLIHFQTPINYWIVLHSEILQLFNETMIGNSATSIKRMERVHSGVKFLVQEVKRVTKPTQITDEMVHPIESVFEIIQKFMNVQNPPIDLLATCLEVCIALVPLFGTEIQSRLCTIGLLPFVTNPNLSYIDYSQGESFQSSVMGYYLVNYERNSGKYSFLIAYLNLLDVFFKSELNNTTSIELPGLIFILRDIFPHITSWQFKDELERTRILYHCVQYFFNMLQYTPEQLRNKQLDLLHKTCIYSLLNIEDGMALLKIVGIGNPYLQALMEDQTNWVSGPGIQYIRLVQISMSTLMHILRLKPKIMEKHRLAPLEHLIYTQPKQKDTLRIVPVVTGYMNHVFNKFLPSLACRLLRRFALEIQMSLMACLDMEPDQIRLLFLQRLRDDSESDDLKTAILELVASCVERQPGLTEAFFRIHHPQEKKKLFYQPANDDIAEGILSYMAEYLSAVHTEPVRLYSPLLSRIMGLFHALWKNQMQILVSDLRKNEKFWTYLTSPLFHDILPEVKAYSQILNIIGIELFENNGEIDNNLRASLEKFFQSKTQLQKWVEHIYNLPMERSVEYSEETPEWLSLLTSWKDFMTISIRLLPFEITDMQKTLIFKQSFNCLTEQVKIMSDPRAVVILAELNFILLSKWKANCTKDLDENELLHTVAELLQHTSHFYNCMHSRAKDSILGAVNIMINLLSETLRNDHENANTLVTSVCKIILYEIEVIAIDSTNDIQNSTMIKMTELKEHKKPLVPSVLGFCVLNRLLKLFKNGFNKWDGSFMCTSLINKVLTFLAVIIPNKTKAEVTVSALDTLIFLAKSNQSKRLLDYDIGQYLWLQLLPPRNLVADFVGEAANGHWQMSEWWPIAIRGIELVRVLLEKHKHSFSSEALVFVGVQEEFLIKAMLLGCYTFRPEALNLVMSSLQLIVELVKYEGQWRREHQDSLINIMRCVQTILHYGISSIYRPRILRLKIDGVAKDKQESSIQGPLTKPSDQVIFVINRLIDIISLACRSLMAFGPSAFNLLTEPFLDLSQWRLIIDVQFGAPKIHTEPCSDISFGTVSAAVSLFTKALTLTFKAKGKFINKISAETINDSVDSIASPGNSSPDKSGSSICIKQTAQALSPLSPGANLTTTSSSMLLSNDWLKTFDIKHTLFALETVLTFLATQALFALRDPGNSDRDRQLIRRELCSEMSSYHEFVRRKVIDTTLLKSNLCRKKLGACVLSEHSNIIDNDSQNSDDGNGDLLTPPPPKKINSSSIRVSVIRKQHLEASKTRAPRPSTSAVVSTPLQNLSPTSPIASSSGLEGPSTSEPSSKPKQLDESGLLKHRTWSSNLSFETSSPKVTSPYETEIHLTPKSSFNTSVMEEDGSICEEIIMLPPEDETGRFCPLTDVQMTEDDYLHLLSNMFLYICPTDSY